MHHHQEGRLRLEPASSADIPGDHRLVRQRGDAVRGTGHDRDGCEDRDPRRTQ
ncbi:hypothetical protein ACFPRL_10670 [Pseudoclavibacter helvolus]